jgi:galactokinase
MDVGKLKAEFTTRFDGEPRIFRAPGRVNVIGEHTDYNDGFVMPFAIDRDTLAAASARSDSKITAVALDLDESAAIDLDAPAVVKRRGTWVDYVEGTARALQERFGLARGADIVFSSTVPIGAGLSSSAALETAIGFALLSVSGIEIDREKLAFAGQFAEHEFVGTKSGIMDQFASAFCQAGNAMLLDCRSLEMKQIQLDIADTMIAVCDTKVKHSLASSEYNKRREECEEGVRLLQQELPEIKALRDIGTKELERFGNILPEPIRRRCRHVVTENERTLSASDAFQKRDVETAGRFMFESHRSLQTDYEVSCVELDALVEIASRVAGVYGARMTGGGFGGCTVNLLKREVFDSFKKSTLRQFSSRFDTKPDIYVFQPADGVSEVTA